MTHPEFQAFIVYWCSLFRWEASTVFGRNGVYYPDKGDGKPRKVRPVENTEHVGLLFAKFGDFASDTVRRCVHTWKLENPDAKSPDIKVIHGMVLREYRAESNEFKWHAADEATLENWFAHFLRTGHPRPMTAADVATMHMGKVRGPTDDERQGARNKLEPHFSAPREAYEQIRQQTEDELQQYRSLTPEQKVRLLSLQRQEGARRKARKGEAGQTKTLAQLIAEARTE